VSRSLKENAIKIFRAQEALKRKLLRDPTIEELSQETGIEPGMIVESMDAVKDPISIYEPVFEESNSNAKVEMIDLMVRDDSEKVIDTLLLKELISKLNAREKKIIMLRYFNDKTQSEIASMLGISQVQVSRLISKTIEKLKKAVEM